MDVSIVVLLAGGASLADRCLSAIAAATHASALRTETVLVLNAVDDATRAVVARRARDAVLIDSPVNTGTNAGWNLAVTAARGRRVALLHEDSEPEPGWLEALLAVLDGDPSAGVVGSRLVGADGAVQYIGAAVWSTGETSQLTARSAPEAVRRTEPFPVDSVPSASLAFDRALWERIGGFEERLFPAMSTEHDFGIATWLSGRRVISQPASVVRHAGGAMVRPDLGARGSARFREFLWRRAAGVLRAKWGPLLDAFGRLPEGTPAAGAGPDEHTDALARAATRTVAEPVLVAPDRSLTGAGLDPAALERAQQAVEREFADWLLAKLEEAEEAVRWHERHRQETADWLASREALIQELRRR